jgi:hypothetical protein
MLESLLPGLENLLGAWLARLEGKVAQHEARYGVASEETSRGGKKLRRPVKTDLDAGRPSVILLGARLTSDRQLCRTLIQRATSLLRRQPTFAGPERRRSVSRAPEYC